MPGGDHCSVPRCTSDRRQDKTISFHVFPGSPVTRSGSVRSVSQSEQETRKKWINAIRRDFTIVPYSTVVCSEHFKDDDYVQGEKKFGARLKAGAVPSVFHWTEPVKRTTSACGHSPPRKAVKKRKSDSAKLKLDPTENTTLRDVVEEAHAAIDDVGSNICLEFFSLAGFEDSDSDIQYYTGFPSIATFDACVNYLRLDDQAETMVWHCRKSIVDAVSCSTRSKIPGGGPKCKLWREKFFLTMVLLRRGTDIRMLADLYRVDSQTVSQVASAMINYMYLRLGVIPIWPQLSQVAENLPAVFKELYPSTFMIIDVTEIQCETALSFPAQSQLHNSCKPLTTLKGLVGMTPGGTVAFVSKLFDGSISNRELTIKSRFLEMLAEAGHGASLVADKDFNIKDLLIPLGVSLNILTFERSGKQIAPEDGQSIAKPLIHVERLTEHIKEYNIFSSTIPAALYPVVNEMWSVCSLLTRFQEVLSLTDLE